MEAGLRKEKHSDWLHQAHVFIGLNEEVLDWFQTTRVFVSLIDRINRDIIKVAMLKEEGEHRLPKIASRCRSLSHIRALQCM